MPEKNSQIECSKCGGIHEPGKCPLEVAAPKKERVLSPEEKEEQERLQKELEDRLSRGWISDAEEIIALAEKKNISLDFSKPEIASACQKGLEKALLANDIDAAEEINNRFLHLAPDKAFELLSPHLKELLEKFEKSLPQFVAQARKSPDLLFSLFAFRANPERLFKTLEANPFLVEALRGNPRFGPKLILKYPEFDEVAREKIKFLFERKKTILSANPELDPHSFEFRQKMQKELYAFDRNQEIIAELKKAGIDVEAWLNYEETRYFTLRSGEKVVPFSERIAMPVSRLEETIASYAYQVKNVLSEYREDLLKIEVMPKSAEELEAQIKRMEEEIAKAKEAGDERKIGGISRGLESLRIKLDQIQKIPLWKRLIDGMAEFTILKEGLTKSQDALIATEKRYQDLLAAKAPSGVELARLKSQIGERREDLKKRLSQLERRVSGFREGLLPLLSLLGKDRAAALVQEIEERVAEQFNHYENDLNTLDALFSEQAETEKEKLEDRSMSIFVWSRNPDIDLYQGNYSPCCICIESAHSGAESPLADYATDLGIQIVNIWDEIKHEPVTAAWCWIGRDSQGRTALVVDNIESNTLYSRNFPYELWKELHAYLERYAKAIGVDRLVLGKANNDLPTAEALSKMPEAGAVYTKLGGQNSRPDGYYLEAEEHSVKLLWEKKAKAREEKKERKEKRPRIKLENLKTEELNDKDFEKVLNLERQVYEEELVRGQEMIREMQEGNGLKYSVVLYGTRPKKKESELLGYLIAYEDKTDEGEDCVYLDDIAVARDLQGLGLGWNLLQKAVERLKEEARVRGKPVLFDMHLREVSQKLFEKHREDLERLGVSLVESALVPDYYDEGEDALYCVYEVKP